VVDDGDVAIPAIFHIIPFRIRSWPGPRIVWDCVSERITPVLQRSGQVPLLIGCGCSVVDRTTQALLHASSQEIHILHIDGILTAISMIPLQTAGGRKVPHRALCGFR
jgi:arginase